MEKTIVTDTFFLRQKAAPATEASISVAVDLCDTLEANKARCVGMAANMIGEAVAVIAFYNGDLLMEMFNPELIGHAGPYVTEEACLSLSGARKTRRFKTVRVRWQDREMNVHTGSFSGFTAQVIQHELDHLRGILI